MIKRRFYRADRGDRDDASSSSSSDSEVESRSSEDSENEHPNPEPESEPEPEPVSNVEADSDDDDDDDDDNRFPSKIKHPSSSTSGYESEDSSGNEIDAESADDDDSDSGKDGGKLDESPILKEENGELTTQAKDQSAVDDLPLCVLKCKSVYKCRLCPKIVCLNEESLKTHLKSKRHSRSEKLLSNGRLKCILNSDGEEEVISDDDRETHAERHARIIALAQEPTKIKNKGLGRQRQRLRLKKKKQENSANIPKSGQQKENRAKRRRKNVD
ncbi:hypothetical protein BVRB_2g027390 isoform A [Beta vulgaris subsp. vulgaris]|uniref:uncharacterized protein LOC104906487 isoform X2 n=1 Tax=Beta vulgaris subsp. vulgaris TaxID=3555 RepID=UPI0005401684|nr:uncharacterized protein LOC104906487 isoform X2 [Beta vulgaris subsp. vulgaris]KMT18608.1 hypothetical protein BVRB_2g027390 isoform A [Beta vulgaris subsp. vulgaris]